MSWQPAETPRAERPATCPPVETVIVPRAHDIGGLEVRRVLPSVKRRMVGPFIFFDQMGPAEFLTGKGIDVRPHPHIGLSTLTWLIEGEILHRDSVGSIQPIRPGEVNWMTAGSGIAHSERTPEELRATGPRLFGLQTWLALPKQHEEVAPAFEHFPATAMPVLEGDGNRVVLIAGTGWGERSPVSVYWPTIYADATMQPGAILAIPPEHEERALYVLSGEVSIAGERFGAGGLLILRPGEEMPVQAVGDARLLVLGGAPMDGPRHIWWNFVSSSKDRIEQAKSDWRAGRFDRVVAENEFIPLPDG